MTMDNRGHIVACDVSAPRLDGAVRRLRRAGVHNVERHLVEPGDKWAKRRAGRFDRVLVDAPCTGTGTWRRNPDARLRLAATDLAELVAKQAAILDSRIKLGSQRRPAGLRYLLAAVRGERGAGARLSGRHPDFCPGAAGRRPGRCPGPPPGAGSVLCADAAPPWHGRVLRRRAGANRVIAIRRARPGDAGGDRRGACGGLAQRLSRHPAGCLPGPPVRPRQAAHYDAAIRSGGAGAGRHRLRRRSGPAGRPARVVGFVTGGPRAARTGSPRARSRRSTCWMIGASAGWAAR